MTSAAVPVALASATCFAFASALQHRAAGQERPHSTTDPRLLLRLLRRPLWLAGGAADLAGAGLHAFALGLGELALVQPLLVSGLFLAIPIEAALDRRRPHFRDLAAVALSAAGLAVFLLTAQPRRGISNPSGPAWLAVAAGSGLAAAACLALARRSAGTPRATLLGIATGVLYAVTAALLKSCTDQLATDPVALLTDWRLYTLAVVGVAGLALNQNAFQGSPLAAPLTALTLTDPVLSLLIAVTAFHERLTTSGVRPVLELAAALGMARGIWLASTTRPPRTDQ